jgi:hypothetical protein
MSLKKIQAKPFDFSTLCKNKFKKKIEFKANHIVFNGKTNFHSFRCIYIQFTIFFISNCIWQFSSPKQPVLYIFFITFDTLIMKFFGLIL